MKLVKTSPLCAMMTKEMIQLKHSISSFSYSASSMLCIAFLGFKSSIIYFIFAIYMQMIYCGIMNVDVYSRWNIYSVAMPVGRKDIIKSKYLITMFYDAVHFIMTGIGLVIWINCFGKDQNIIPHIAKYINLSSAVSIAGSVSMLMIFARGAYYGGRIAWICNIIILFVSVLFYSMVLRPLVNNGAYTIFIFLLILVCTFAVLVRLGSFILSIRMYSKRSL